jgi:hypothetical protein
VLVSVADDNLADHDARLGGGVVERLPGHDDHAQAIATTLLVIVGVLLDGGGLGGDQRNFPKLIFLLWCKIFEFP